MRKHIMIFLCIETCQSHLAIFGILLLTDEYLPHTVLDCKVIDPQATTSSYLGPVYLPLWSVLYGICVLYGSYTRTDSTITVIWTWRCGQWLGWQGG